MKRGIGLLGQGSDDQAVSFMGKQMIDQVTSGNEQYLDQFSSITPRAGGQSLSDRFSNSTFGQNFDTWSAGLGIANNAFTGIFGEKSEYSGDSGNITRSMDNAYDTVQGVVGKLGPYGQIISLGMGANKLLGNVVGKLGGGTDGMTATDSILGSSFLSLTPLGLINGFGGRKADTITKDNQAFETVGSSYTGSNQKVDDALQKSGKKYGLFSNKARKRANQEIFEATTQQNIISDIADTATDLFNIRNSMAAINGNRYKLHLQGGYNQGSIRVGKKGLKIQNLDKAREFIKSYKQQQTNQLQQGGPIDPFEYYLQSLPESQKDSSNFRVKDYWVFNGKPKDFTEARRRGMFTQQNDGWHANTIAWNPETGEGEFMKSPDHPSIQQEVEWYNSDDGAGFRNDYELVKSSPYWKYVRRKEIPSHKQGGTFIELTVEETSIELINPMSIPEFQKGGTLSQKVKDYYNGYDLSDVTLVNDSSPRTEGSIIYSPSDEYTVHELWHYLSQNKPNEALKEFYDQLDDTKLQEFGADLEFVKRTGDPGDFYNPSELEARLKAAKFMSQGSLYDKEFFRNLRGDENRYGDNMRDLLRMFDDDHLERLFNVLPKFQNGGSINVIPDGALHARKHNMDMKGITKKGIPVVSEKDGGIEQQAEIERNEVILRLEVTQKLEELEKKFYSDESTQEEKDEYALEAGKLLVYELLENTIDNTGLLNET